MGQDPIDAVAGPNPSVDVPFAAAFNIDVSAGETRGSRLPPVPTGEGKLMHRCVFHPAALALLIATTGPAAAAPDRKPAPPAPRAAAPRAVGGFAGMRGPVGVAHLPGNMGGPHLPSGMAGGAHLPGGMPTGAHIPSGMAGAHLPENMGGGPHLLAEVPRTGMTQNARFAPARSASGRPDAVPMRTARPSVAHATSGPLRSMVSPGPAGAEVHPPRDAAEALRGARPVLLPPSVGHGAFRAAVLHDPRLVAGFPSHTRWGDGQFARPGPRGFLRPPGPAQFDHDHAFVMAHQHDFHGRFVRDFDHHDLERWRSGTWRNEWHYGRRGWWWEVNGVWYDYPDPVFPYPLEVAALTAYQQPTVDGPDLQAEELASVPPPAGEAPASPATTIPATTSPAPTSAAPTSTKTVGVGEAMPVIPPLPAPPPGRYACADPRGFFPDVGDCRADWTLAADTQEAQSGAPP